jgi:hypothetical protein
MTPATLELLLENEEELSIFNGEYVQPVSELQYSKHIFSNLIHLITTSYILG